MVTVELLGVGIASRHHRRLLGDAQIGLPQSHRMRTGQAIEPLDRCMQELASVGKAMFLGCTVVSTVIRAKSLVRNAPLACATRRLSASSRSSLSPSRFLQWLRSGALVREGVLGERLAGEVLEVRVVDPALADTFVGQPEYMLEQQQADHEAALDAGSPLVAVERRDLSVDPRPVYLAAKLHQLVLHVDGVDAPSRRRRSVPRW